MAAHIQRLVENAVDSAFVPGSIAAGHAASGSSKISPTAGAFMIENSKQVDSSHYSFESYVTKGRWSSIWHQLDEVRRLAGGPVLEIGPGPGIFKALASTFGLSVETLDLDPDLKPDHVGSATALPFADGSFDTVCAFQMLEHLPYDVAMQAFREMVRVASGHVVISLPDCRPTSRFMLHIPHIGTVRKLIPTLFWRPQAHAFDGEHYWEIDKRETRLVRVTADLSAICPLLRSYRVLDYPYHRYFIFKRS